jgi:hypothetical protein
MRDVILRVGDLSAALHTPIHTKDLFLQELVKTATARQRSLKDDREKRRQNKSFETIKK